MNGESICASVEAIETAFVTVLVDPGQRADAIILEEDPR
jgi:hypothetical protein